MSGTDKPGHLDDHHRPQTPEDLLRQLEADVQALTARVKELAERIAQEERKEPDAPSPHPPRPAAGTRGPAPRRGTGPRAMPPAGLRQHLLSDPDEDS